MSLPIALTLGDPAGIGGEISLKAWQHLAGDVSFFVIGDVDYLTKVAAAQNLTIARIEHPDQIPTQSTAMPVLHLPLAAPVIPGQPAPANAAPVIAAIAQAVELVETHQATALTTNPINKKALKDGAGFAFPGHTEYLAHLTNAKRAVMMLSAPALRVVPVTIHIPIADVPSQLTASLLEETIRITHAAMRRDLGLSDPKIMVAGLNPHAGEGGTMGREEIDLIIPVLESLRDEGMNISGPAPADTMFHPEARARYDLAICMYHDQALIPIKTLDFASGVNTTLGLPIIRTSPDHGTAYDIAGKNRADPRSLIAALRQAKQMAQTRASYDG